MQKTYRFFGKENVNTREQQIAVRDHAIVTFCDHLNMNRCNIAKYEDEEKNIAAIKERKETAPTA